MEFVNEHETFDPFWTSHQLVQEEPDGPPPGTSKEILDWVSGDPERAQEALYVEESGNARKTLLSELRKLIK